MAPGVCVSPYSTESDKRDPGGGASELLVDLAEQRATINEVRISRKRHGRKRARWSFRAI